MFIDARQVAEGSLLEGDLCIIGAGAAGITIAREMGGRGRRVLLLESGGETLDDETHALTSAVNLGRPYPSLPISRLRFFGGSTNHWGGHCTPLRPGDFEARPQISDGWPIGYRDLEPYYRRAHEVIGLGPFDYRAEVIARRLGLPLAPFDPARVQTVVSRYQAKRFGPDFRAELSKARALDVVLHANVTLIDRHRDKPVVRQALVQTLDGTTFQVRARLFVLAAGGIENARLLLASDNVEAGGLGNGAGLVGRYFMDHIWYPSGVIVPADPRSRYDLYGGEIPLAKAEGSDLGYAARAHLAMPEAVVRAEQIPDFRVEIGVGHNFTGRSDAIHSARELHADLWARRWPDDLRYHLANIFDAPGDVVAELMGWKRQGTYLVLNNHVEQTPNPDSRISLATQRDRLGQRRAAVDWRLSPIDKFGIRRAQELIAAEVGRSGFGRLRIELADVEALVLAGADGGAHHMGTTRMSDDPRRGVVDRHCRMHGLENLYVAGSSVFPRCGYANPTLTITALSLRLADHLRHQLGEARA
jgi:choline dehydrogenase-like flavoprotein